MLIRGYKKLLAVFLSFLLVLGDLSFYWQVRNLFANTCSAPRCYVTSDMVIQPVFDANKGVCTYPLTSSGCPQFYTYSDTYKSCISFPICDGACQWDASSRQCVPLNLPSDAPSPLPEITGNMCAVDLNQNGEIESNEVAQCASATTLSGNATYVCPLDVTDCNAFCPSNETYDPSTKKCLSTPSFSNIDQSISQSSDGGYCINLTCKDGSTQRVCLSPSDSCTWANVCGTRQAVELYRQGSQTVCVSYYNNGQQQGPTCTTLTCTYSGDCNVYALGFLGSYRHLESYVDTDGRICLNEYFNGGVRWSTCASVPSDPSYSVSYNVNSNEILQISMDVGQYCLNYSYGSNRYFLGCGSYNLDSCNVYALGFLGPYQHLEVYINVQRGKGRQLCFNKYSYGSVSWSACTSIPYYQYYNTYGTDRGVEVFKDDKQYCLWYYVFNTVCDCLEYGYSCDDSGCSSYCVNEVCYDVVNKYFLGCGKYSKVCSGVIGCPEGMVATGGQCVNINCPEGATYDSSLGKCVRNPDYGCPNNPEAECVLYQNRVVCSSPCGQPEDTDTPDEPPSGFEDDAEVTDTACLGTVYIFNGKKMRCRPSGLSTGFQNCCNKAQGRLYDNTGSLYGTFMTVKNVISAIAAAKEIVKISYYATKIASGEYKVVGNAIWTWDDSKLIARLNRQQAQALQNVEVGMTSETAIQTATTSYISQLKGEIVLAIINLAVSQVIDDPIVQATVNLAATLIIANTIGLANPVLATVMAVVQLVLAFFAGGCDEQDIMTSTLKESGYCHYVGSRCIKKILGTCVQKAKVYCCFNSKLARIIHEQGRPQLSTDLRNWGSAKNPNCRGFTPEEFQALDFSQMDLSEYYADIERNVRQNVEGAINTQLQETYQGIKYGR